MDTTRGRSAPATRGLPDWIPRAAGLTSAALVASAFPIIGPHFAVGCVLVVSSILPALVAAQGHVLTAPASTSARARPMTDKVIEALGQVLCLPLPLVVGGLACGV